MIDPGGHSSKIDVNGYRTQPKRERKRGMCGRLLSACRGEGGVIASGVNIIYKSHCRPMLDYSPLTAPSPAWPSSLNMAPKGLKGKLPSTSKSATTADASPKPSRTAWKTGEQLEFLLSHWDRYVTHQTDGTLDRFWPRVYDAWYKAWKITPSAEAIKQYGSSENAILTLRSENNSVRMTNFYASNLEPPLTTHISH